MSAPDTKESLLDAAERLFADHGIGATSLRAITTAAGANLASVNYHFGSKEALVRAILDRRLTPLNQERLRLLEACEKSRPEPSLESVLEAFVMPVLQKNYEMTQEQEQGANRQALEHAPGPGGGDWEGWDNFRRLLGRCHFEADAQIRGLVVDSFREVISRFLAALGRCLPHLSHSELMWRFFFLTGTLAMAATNGTMIREVSDGVCDPTQVEAVISRLVNFLAAGFRAPSTAAAEV